MAETKLKLLKLEVQEISDLLKEDTTYIFKKQDFAHLVAYKEVDSVPAHWLWAFQRVKPHTVSCEAMADDFDRKANRSDIYNMPFEYAVIIDDIGYAIVTPKMLEWLDEKYNEYGIVIQLK